MVLHVDKPEPGSSFTKELAVCATSVMIVRGQDDQIRAFHNLCRHRGNELVWRDWTQPHVPDSGAAYPDLVLEPTP